MLVREARKSKRSESSEYDQRRIEEDQTGLGCERIVCKLLASCSTNYRSTFTKDDQASSKRSSRCPAPSGFQGQEHGGNSQDATNGR